MEEIRYLTQRNPHQVEATHPNQIRYLLVVSLLAKLKNEWQTNVDNQTFYNATITELRNILNCTDEELKAKFPSLPFLK
jgi:hypothetical protein